MEFDKLQEETIDRIGEKRFAHTLRVMEKAEELALIHNIDPEKAKVAAFFHDSMKIKGGGALEKEAEKYKLPFREEWKEIPSIAHGYLAAEMIKTEYGITDEEILNAIRYHTTGRAGMSSLEILIYLADYIEEGREFPGVEKIRSVAKNNLEEAFDMALGNTIRFLIEKKQKISIDSILCWNERVNKKHEELY
ncbi:bis(5'-nucleosyl)-tetraphosphatase (symmetrical) YqeK [Peptoniphilus sp. KCTC 25270]|uniref:bis(5'-nucleosyl)-tetraphosphatase (symmetrical) YqeK n=1 Tax=Peptoniphilus sp. KCTC 25270 TaxID=2897414 RepID=UPI001E5AA78E|nr:bis(5'-nucleosyl)-tetraphosphatase (symmetrical) YqeK [Peptoniphilus sp. KCTC 25270]MCD1146923.1 bis(5'-nucleosyl)-tetraphosphatase (symmetrical) YqeK [Peptoniphilus sp. KCTC 25270]